MTETISRTEGRVVVRRKVRPTQAQCRALDPITISPRTKLSVCEKSAVRLESGTRELARCHTSVMPGRLVRRESKEIER